MEKTKVSVLKEDVSSNGMHRRKFLGIMGGTASVVAVAAACNNDDDNTPYDGGVVEADGTVNLGRGDVGILNYAYALEQLEAAFYTKVVTDSTSVFSADELTMFTAIRDHEIAHREFFKNVLSTKAIPPLVVNFSAINFADRTSVLGTAQAFEDLGVSAYNGAGPLIVSADYLLLAGKIVSVEARHAGLIRDLVVANTFSDTADAMGLDIAKSTTEVLTTAQAYLTTKVTGKDLPTS